MKKALFFVLVFIWIDKIIAQIIRLDSSELPIVIIDTRGKTIANDPKIEAHMKIIFNGQGKKNYSSSKTAHYNNFIGIEIRGNSSQSYPQKQFAIELRDSVSKSDIDFPLLDLPEEEDWVLYAPYNDISLMRNVLTYHLWNQMGHWGPRTKFCEVILNGEYQGIYILTESIKRNAERIDIAKLNPEDTTGLEITGGYIMKIDKKNNPADKSFISAVKSTNNQNITWLYHYPESDDINVKQQDYIKKFIDSFELALSGARFMDPNLGFRKYISTESFIDYLLISEFTRNVDAYKASSFFYKEKLDSNGTKGKLKAGPVWDYNFALGNASFCSGGLTTGWMYDGCIPATLPTPEMWRRLLQDSVMANEIKCRYNYLRKTYLDTAYLNQYINRYAFDTLKNPITRHYNKWKIIGTNPGGFNAYIATSYPDEISRLKTWMHNRLVWMDQNLKGVCREALPPEAKIKAPLSSPCQPNYTQAVEKSQIFNRMPYNYTGLEKINSIPKDIVRWVLLELRSASDTTQLIARRAALLRLDLRIVDTNFSSTVLFPNVNPNLFYKLVVRYDSNYFIQFKNRIKLPHTGELDLTQAGNIISFTSKTDLAFANSLFPQKDLVVCQDEPLIYLDQNLKNNGYKNLKLKVNSSIENTILDSGRIEVKTDKAGIYPFEIEYFCGTNYLSSSVGKVVVAEEIKGSIESINKSNYCLLKFIPSAGKGLLTYQWSNGNTSDTASYSNGNYSLKVSDIYDCSEEFSGNCIVVDQEDTQIEKFLVIGTIIRDEIIFTSDAKQKIKSILLYNNLGNLILEQKHLSQMNINVAHLPSGLYYLLMETIDKKISVMKLVKGMDN